MVTDTKLTVEIYGRQYTMRGNESASHMKAVASYVDDKMKEVAECNPRLDTARLAVLSAVNISDDYLKLKEEYNELLELIDEK